MSGEFKTKSPALWAMLAHDYASGMSGREVARKWEVAHTTVQDAVAFHHIARPKPNLKPCGTLAAYHRHRRKHETPCWPCMDVYNEARHAKKGKA